MGFREVIQDVVATTPGARACTVMGFDGIVVDTYALGEGLDTAALLAEYGQAMRGLLRSMLLEEQTGNVEELVVTSERATTVLRPLNEDYFLSLVLDPDAISGRARYRLRLAVPKLQKLF